MVFSPLEDWKVRLLSIGMLDRKVGSLLGGCWVVERKSDWMTRPTRCCILYQSKTSSIVTSWSCHHCTISPHHHAIWWWVMRSNRYWISPSLSPGICQVSITLFPSCDPFILCFIILSLTICHMPLSLLIFRPIPFPWWRFPFVLDDSLISMTHFISYQSYQSFSPSFLPLFFIVVLFMVRTFVEFCHGHSFCT